MATFTKRGDLQWQAKIRKKGFISVTRTFNTKAEAEAWAKVTEAEMIRGVFVDRSEAESTTLGEALYRYEREVSVHKKGHAQEKSKIGKWLRHPLAKRSLANLRSSDFAKYRDERLAEGASPATVRLYLALISHLFSVAAKEWGMPLQNPIENIRMPQVDNARDRRLSAAEEKALLAELGKGSNPNPWMKPLVVFALETAMRQGELVKLEWRHVDLAKRSATLIETKNGSKRSVPLSSRAVEVLRSLPRSFEGKVFPTTESAIKQSFLRACVRADATNLHFHDLRHEATSRLARKVPNIIELAAITGHKDVRMLKRYYHTDVEDLARKLG